MLKILRRWQMLKVMCRWHRLVRSLHVLRGWHHRCLGMERRTSPSLLRLRLLGWQRTGSQGGAILIRFPEAQTEVVVAPPESVLSAASVVPQIWRRRWIEVAADGVGWQRCRL